MRCGAVGTHNCSGCSTLWGVASQRYFVVCQPRPSLMAVGAPRQTCAHVARMVSVCVVCVCDGGCVENTETRHSTHGAGMRKYVKKRRSGSRRANCKLKVCVCDYIVRDMRANNSHILWYMTHTHTQSLLALCCCTLLVRENPFKQVRASWQCVNDIARHTFAEIARVCCPNASRASRTMRARCDRQKISPAKTLAFELFRAAAKWTPLSPRSRLASNCC